jgi:hypothetical protein
MNDIIAMPEVLSCYPFGSEHHVVFHDPGQAVEPIESKLKAGGHIDLLIKRIEPTIEDCFMDLMKSPESQSLKV